MQVPVFVALSVLSGIEARYKPSDLVSRAVVPDVAWKSVTDEPVRALRQANFGPKAIAYFPSITAKAGESTRPEGFITFTYLNESSAQVEVRLSNLPEGKGPFSYHIHTNRVPEEITDPTTQCKDAKAHLDPQDVGEAFKCDPTQRQLCQVGDV